MPTPLIHQVSCPSHRFPAEGCSCCHTATSINARLLHEHVECGGWTRCRFHPDMDKRAENYVQRAVTCAETTERGGEFTAAVPGLRGPVGRGDSEDQALSFLSASVLDWLVRRADAGMDIPPVGGMALGAPAAA